MRTPRGGARTNAATCCADQPHGAQTSRMVRSAPTQMCHTPRRGHGVATPATPPAARAKGVCGVAPPKSAGAIAHAAGIAQLIVLGAPPWCSRRHELPRRTGVMRPRAACWRCVWRSQRRCNWILMLSQPGRPTRHTQGCDLLAARYVEAEFGEARGVVTGCRGVAFRRQADDGGGPIGRRGQLP